MNKKQVLYLSYDGMTDPLGQSQVLPYIVGLTKEGYSFTLVSCEKKERYVQHRKIIEQICNDNNIDWQPIFYTKNPPVLSTNRYILGIRFFAICFKLFRIVRHLVYGG